MATKVGICNLSLRLLGAQRIDAIADPNERARVLNDVYAEIRDEVLKSHPWNFAIKRDDLTEITATSPEFQWDTWFTLPTDCLRVIRMEDNAKFVVEGGVLLTNESTAEIKYIAQITDETSFSAEFVTCFAARLAAEVCYAITNSKTLTTEKWDEYLAKLTQAKSIDAQEGTADKEDDSDWIDLRE